MDITGSFRVNRGKFIGANVQCEVLLLKDRLLLIKTGDEPYDLRYIAAYMIPVVVLGICTGMLGILLIRPYIDSWFLAFVLSILFVVIGLGIGAWIGGIAVNRFAKPKYIKAEWYGELNSISPEQLLSRDKDNVMILLSDITSVQLKKSLHGIYGPRTGKITLQDITCDIAPGQNFDEIKALLGDSLPDKLEA